MIGEKAGDLGTREGGAGEIGDVGAGVNLFKPQAAHGPFLEIKHFYVAQGHAVVVRGNVVILIAKPVKADESLLAAAFAKTARALSSGKSTPAGKGKSAA